VSKVAVTCLVLAVPFDRFSICLAYYYFAIHYHGGQFSKEYAILGRLEKIGFKTGQSFESMQENDPNAFELYQNLVEKHSH
jgi:hypothetical protein